MDMGRSTFVWGHLSMPDQLFQQYNKPVPRYTSYPPVPCWDTTAPTQENWFREVKRASVSGNRQLSLYIHLLFCESLCTYCACNKRITTDHSVEAPYIQRLLKEWSMYLDAIGATPSISELHLGGGSPTFFSAANLDHLLKGILSSAQLATGAALSFEAHPASTTSAHLETLHRNGFRRISIGVQDFDPTVQQLIHRRQSDMQVRAITNLARIIGYTSINFDLIYGLPGQSRETMAETVRKVIDIRPDRIAFYGYAHVPSLHPAQKSYEAFVPNEDLRTELYILGRELLVQAGYREIGLDHFALPGDELLVAAISGELHRNFMGYTEHQSPLLVALGPSAISDCGSMLIQNHHKLEEWGISIDSGMLPIVKGHVRTEEDMVINKHIHNIMCKGETNWALDKLSTPFLETVTDRLAQFRADGLVRTSADYVKVLDKGRPFLRQIAHCFDARSAASHPNEFNFSKP